MRIVIHDVRKRDKREKIREATALFLRELIPQHIRQGVKVEVFVNPYMKKDQGRCAALRPRKGTRPSSFQVELHPHKWRWSSLLKTLGHEIVHVKQFAIGEMFEPSDGVTVWKSRKIIDKEVPYHKHPWEVEAAGNEELLWEIWKKRHLY